jgi:hypothetical protein
MHKPLLAKKGIVGMFETILVVFVVVIFFGIGLIIYARLERYSLSSEYSEIGERRALRVEYAATSMPEFSCEACGRMEKKGCFDTVKLDEFATISDKYYSFFGTSKLEVKQIYPEEKTWTLYDKKPEGWVRTYVPILLCDPSQRNYNFGVLTIDVLPK